MPEPLGYSDEERPWRRDMRMAESMAQLEAVYRHWATIVPGDLMAHMNQDTNTRKAELQAEQIANPPQSPQQAQSTLEKLEQIDLQSLQATLDYGDALAAWATADATFRKLEAKTYMRFKVMLDEVTGKPIANAEAEMRTAADDDVADARLQKNITEGQVKAARSRMEQLERSFEYHRSLMVNERKVDQRG